MTSRRPFHNVPQFNFLGKLNVFKLPETQIQIEAYEAVDRGGGRRTDIPETDRDGPTQTFLRQTDKPWADRHT